MNYVDLHIHSTNSDGTCTPSQILEIAKEGGLTAVAVTDHDSVGGIEEAQNAGTQNGIEVIPGIEVGSGYHGRSIHMLGYFFDRSDPGMQEMLDWVVWARKERNDKVLRLMQDDGIDISREQLEADYPHAALGRPHFARRMVELGYADSVKDAFMRYLNPGQKYYIRRQFVPLEKAVEVVRGAGGIAVLAHPFQYRFEEEERQELFAHCRQIGIEGIECYYSGYTAEQIGYLLQTAEKYGFHPTGGSDFHGENKPHIKIGTGTGDLRVPYTVVEGLREILVSR